MKRFNPYAFVLVFLIAGAAVANIWNVDFNGVRVGDYGTGTKTNIIEAHNLAFVNDTSSTTTTNVGSSYYVAHAWKTSSADPGKITAAVSSGVLTVTSASATTGTCSVILIGAP